MKKTIIISLLMFPSILFAQEKFSGIGIFKLNADTNVIYDYSKTKNQSIRNIDDGLSLYQLEKKNNVNELLKKKSDSLVYKIVKTKNGIGSSRCAETVEFFINQYTIAGINVYNLKLTYFNNTLVKVKCNYSDPLREALTVKYGAPILKRTSKEIDCIYKLTGISQKNTEDTFYENWDNGPITATGTTAKYFNDKCEKQYLSYFIYEMENPEFKKCETSSTLDRPKLSKEQLKDF